MNSEEGKSQNTFRVLVIDDKEADRRLVTALLVEAWPFSRDLIVDCASNGPEALEKLRHHRFALIILDWKLPMIGGSEILHSIRREGRRLPVVVVSGLKQDEIDEDFESLGAAFLHKDRMNIENFYNAIATSLGFMGLSETLLEEGVPSEG